MNESEFWAIIQRCVDECDGDQEAYVDRLGETLLTLPPAEVAAFEAELFRLQQRAYTWDLWGAAYVINGGCGDDGFEYFLSWLISRGQAWYERALAQADDLAEYPEYLADASEFEDFAYVAADVYLEQTGEELPTAEGSRALGEPQGKGWDEEDEAGFKTRWPRLYAKYT